MKRIAVIVFLLALPAVPAAAQGQQPALNLGYAVEVKAGAAMSFEQALKQHVQWLREQKEQWSWNIWQAAVGENLSTYVIMSGGHSFADFDAHTDFARTNRDRWLANVSQHVASISSEVSVTRSDLGRPPDSTQTPNMVWVISMKLAQGTEQEFEYALKRTLEGLQKANWPGRYLWHQAVMGQSGTTYRLIIPGMKWVDFNPPSTPMEAALEKAYGKQGAMELLATFRKVIVEETSAVYVLRPDLSYNPAGQ